MSHVIEATILTGCGKGESIFVPRIPVVPTDMPFEFKRLQCPVRLAVTLSINKTQRQSLKGADINLETLCISHDQLYVMCSRVGIAKSSDVFVLLILLVNINPLKRYNQDG